MRLALPKGRGPQGGNSKKHGGKNSRAFDEDEREKLGAECVRACKSFQSKS
jgi:hypothetical protein